VGHSNSEILGLSLRVRADEVRPSILAQASDMRHGDIGSLCATVITSRSPITIQLTFPSVKHT